MDQASGRFGVNQGHCGFLGFAGLSGGCRIDFGKSGEHGRECAFAAMADVHVSGTGNLRLGKVFENLNHQGKSGQRVVYRIDGLFAGFQGRVTFRFGEHTRAYQTAGGAERQYDQFGILDCS
jgi:hypothetical protein